MTNVYGVQFTGGGVPKRHDDLVLACWWMKRNFGSKLRRGGWLGNVRFCE